MVDDESPAVLLDAAPEWLHLIKAPELAVGQQARSVGSGLEEQVTTGPHGHTLA